MSTSEMKLGLDRQLRTLVANSYQAAKQSKSLVFSDTELSIIKSKNGAPFQLRYCPALAKKPTGAPQDKTEASHSKPKADPFDDPPADLLVAEIPQKSPSHILVLNKYPVIANHFILATKQSKPQTDLLEEDDLGMTYECLRAWRTDTTSATNGELFAFFNSGEHSGASQVHRHLQFLPVEDMKGDEHNGWQLLSQRMIHRAHPEMPLYHDPTLPFVQYATEVGTDVTPSGLYSKYKMLLSSAVVAVRRADGDLSDEEKFDLRQGTKPTISYNLAMTKDMMAICPRRSEAASVPIEGAESSVAINGTILGGTLMVKDERERDSLRENPELLDAMLRSIGYPITHEHDSAETKL